MIFTFHVQEKNLTGQSEQLHRKTLVLITRMTEGSTSSLKLPVAISMTQPGDVTSPGNDSPGKLGKY